MQHGGDSQRLSVAFLVVFPEPLNIQGQARANAAPDVTDFHTACVSLPSENLKAEGSWNSHRTYIATPRPALPSDVCLSPAMHHPPDAANSIANLKGPQNYRSARLNGRSRG